jgi:hypothetical protein
MLRALLAREFPDTAGDVPLTDTLAHVELTWIEKRIEHWIRFGSCHAHEQILDRRRRILSFPPGTVFAFLRWAANDYGTVVSCIDIVRVTRPGEPYQTVVVRWRGSLLRQAVGRRSVWCWKQSIVSKLPASTPSTCARALAASAQSDASRAAARSSRDRHQAWLRRRAVS